MKDEKIQIENLKSAIENEKSPFTSRAKGFAVPPWLELGDWVIG
jgi:hypothetical protein